MPVMQIGVPSMSTERRLDLVDGVGGQDTAGGVDEGLLVGAELLEGVGDAGGDFFDGEQFTDHAGGHDEDLFVVDSADLGGLGGHEVGVFFPLHSGAGIGHPGIGDNYPHGLRRSAGAVRG